MIDPELRLLEAGLLLPASYPTAGNYSRFRRVGNLLFLSGIGPRLDDGGYICGCLCGPDGVTVGYEAARLATLHLLRVLKTGLGDLRKVDAVVKVLGMVNATSDFTLHPKVIDGCSDTLVTAFGEDVGQHARSAVGMASLPHGMMVEIEAVFAVRD